MGKRLVFHHLRKGFLRVVYSLSNLEVLELLSVAYCIRHWPLETDQQVLHQCSLELYLIDSLRSMAVGDSLMYLHRLPARYWVPVYLMAEMVKYHLCEY